MTGNITQARDGKTKLGKLNSWSLFKAIKCTSKVTNLVWFNRKTKSRLHMLIWHEVWLEFCHKPIRPNQAQSGHRN